MPPRVSNTRVTGRLLLLFLALPCGTACDGRGGSADAYRLPTSRSADPPETEDDPASADASAVDLIGAPDFRFAFGDGSGWHGYNVLTVTADGTAVYTFFDYVAATTAAGEPLNRQRWHRARFKLDAPTVVALRTLLQQVDFWRLKKAYHAPVHDGTQRWAKVEASGRRKGVYWNNRFPDPFDRLHGFVERQILAPHQPAIAAAEMIELDAKDAESETYDD